MDENTTNNVDESASKEVEESFGGGSYYFFSIQDPNPDNSVYENGEKFTVAMLNQKDPTLLVHGGKYANMKEIELENLLPFAFPYGTGTPKQKQPNCVSFKACIQHTTLYAFGHAPIYEGRCDFGDESHIWSSNLIPKRRYDK